MGAAPTRTPLSPEVPHTGLGTGPAPRGPSGSDSQAGNRCSRLSFAKSRWLNSHDVYDNYVLGMIITRISTYIIDATQEGLRIQWKKHIKVLLLFREK